MRDEHRSKQELIHEITGLRKQVGDLKEAMVARRRVEDALRESLAQLRSLADNAPVGLGLFRSDGALLSANQLLARTLGYQSVAELQSLSAVLGVFASPEDRARVLGSPAEAVPRPTLFRDKDGSRLLRGVLAGRHTDNETLVLAVLDCAPHQSSAPFPAPSA
jgi:PAS domain S-box-containing protein